MCRLGLTSAINAAQVDPGATPGWSGGGETPGVGATPSGKARSRWDETPAGSAGVGATPMMGGATPGWGGATPAYGVTPFGGMGMDTPTPSQLPQVHTHAHVCSLHYHTTFVGPLDTAISSSLRSVVRKFNCGN